MTAKCFLLPAALSCALGCSLQDLDALATDPNNVGMGGTSGGSMSMSGSNSGGTAGTTTGSGGEAGTAGSGATAGQAGTGGAGGGAPDFSQGLLDDPSFEEGLDGWVGFGDSLLERETSRPHSGVWSVASFNRLETWQGPFIRILSRLETGGIYSVSAWLRTDGEEETVTLQSVVTCESFVEGDAGGIVRADEYNQRGTATINGDWTELTGAFDVTECDNMVDYRLYFEGPAVEVKFYLDDVLIVKTN